MVSFIFIQAVCQGRAVFMMIPHFQTGELAGDFGRIAFAALK
jgi:hypothetical protein